MFKIFTKKALKVEKPSENDKDYSSKIITWGLHQDINTYPIRVLKSISESPTASACMSTKTDYIRGGGFNIQGLESIKVNKDEKLNSLHNGLSETVNKLKGIGIHVRRDVEGNIVELTKIPFEDLRLGLPNEKNIVETIAYNPRWEQRDFKWHETIYYDIYTSDNNKFIKRLTEFQNEQAKKKIKDRKKYPGEIYWNAIKKDGYPFYPYQFSEFDIKAFETDSAFTDFDYNNILNNFFLGGVINIFGDPNEQIKETRQFRDKQGILQTEEYFVETRGEQFNREMQNEFGGSSNTGKFMVNWMQTEAQKMDISAFPTNTNSDLFEKTQARIWNKISHITKVPNILANIETAGKLGNSQEILNAIQLINNSVTIQQSLLEEAYNELLPKHVNFATIINGQEIAIKRKMPVSFIPTEVWNVIPDADKLRYVSENYDIDIKLSEQEEDEGQSVSIEPIQEQAQTNDTMTNLTGRQMQNLQRIVRKFNKGDLTYDQAATMLKSAFGFTDEEVKVWLDGIDDNENVEITDEK